MCSVNLASEVTWQHSMRKEILSTVHVKSVRQICEDKFHW